MKNYFFIRESNFLDRFRHFRIYGTTVIGFVKLALAASVWEFISSDRWSLSYASFLSFFGENIYLYPIIMTFGGVIFILIGHRLSRIVRIILNLPLISYLLVLIYNSLSTSPDPSLTGFFLYLSLYLLCLYALLRDAPE